MILRESRALEWIQQRADEFRAYPYMIEKVIRALTLLESLVSAELNFIFKGGTSLMLLIDEPRRFSIDIDILVDPETTVEDILAEVSAAAGFDRYEEDIRKPRNIVKKHYKFYYGSVIVEEEAYVLLDVVFQANPFTDLESVPVKHFLLQSGDEPINVLIPPLPALLGDKLTAFAPTTCGVLLEDDRMGVAKQLYDVAGIYDRLTNLETVLENYQNVCAQVIQYRGVLLTPNDVLQDTIDTAINFCSHGNCGRVDQDQYRILIDGIHRLAQHIYGEKFRGAKPEIAMAKSAYIASCIRKRIKTKLVYSSEEDLSTWTFDDKRLVWLNKMKKGNPEAFFFMFRALAE